MCHNILQHLDLMNERKAKHLLLKHQDETYVLVLQSIC